MRRGRTISDYEETAPPTLPPLRPLVDAACTREGCSHAILATRAGLTPQYLSRVLLGQVDPTTRTLGRILAACGVRLAPVSILCGCGKVVEPERYCYAIPTCYACLPPPPPIPVV